MADDTLKNPCSETPEKIRGKKYKKIEKGLAFCKV